MNITSKIANKVLESCWKGYKQMGTKKKGDKTVPNCIPEENKPSIEIQKDKERKRLKKLEFVLKKIKIDSDE